VRVVVKGLIGLNALPVVRKYILRDGYCHEDATSRPLELLWGKSSSITTYSI
jgi:hypothetical protein